MRVNIGRDHAESWSLVKKSGREKTVNAEMTLAEASVTWCTPPARSKSREVCQHLVDGPAVLSHWRAYDVSQELFTGSCLAPILTEERFYAFLVGRSPVEYVQTQVHRCLKCSLN